MEPLHCLKARGPYQEWLARTASDAELPGLVVARLPHKERPDPEALSKRLSVAAAAARQVEHQNVLHCYGTIHQGPAGIAQILELNTGMDLEQLFGFLRKTQARLPVTTAVWLVREAAEAVAHAHSLSVVHGGLSPSLIALLPEGGVKVDFGLAAGAGSVDDATLTDFVDLRYTRPEWTAHDHPQIPQMDVWALGAILMEALTGEPPQTSFSDDATERQVVTVPDELRAPLRAALDSNAPDTAATELVAALTRVFYKTLKAEDETHGRAPLLEWLERAGGTDPAVAGALNDHSDTVYPINGLHKPSEFTQALQAREGPVRPRDFTTDDFAQEPSGPEWPPVQAPDAPTQPPQAETAGSEKATQPVQSQPDLMAPDLLLPTPSRSQPPASSSSLSDLAISRPSRVTWFLTGFAATLVLLVLLRDYFKF